MTQGLIPPDSIKCTCIVVGIMFFLTIFKDAEGGFLWLAGMLYIQQIHSMHAEFLLVKSTTTP